MIFWADGPTHSLERLMSESKVAATTRRRPNVAARWVAGAVVLVAAGVALVAHAEGPGGPGMGGPGGGMMMFGGPPEHMGHMIDHMLDGLGVTDAQRSQIRQIVMSAGSDLKTQREAGRGGRDRAVQIFTAPSVDANAAEALRQQMETQHDQASKRMLQAMLDASKVLTPEQRAKLAQRAAERESIMQERMQREQREHGPRQPK
jgi:periplasmic protein CpxP/Spy